MSRDGAAVDVAPAVGAVPTTAQAVELATGLLWPGADLAEPPGDMEDLARTILAWAPVVASAGPLVDALAAMREADPTRRPDGGPAVDFEAAVRAMRAAGGGA